MNPQVNLYKKNQVYTNSNENLVLMLYDGARRILNRAVKAMEAGNIQQTNHDLLHAQSIIAELMAGVNFDAGDLAWQLFSLYEYMHYRLIQANINKDVQDCKEVLAMIEELRTAWITALKDRTAQPGDFAEKKLKIG